MSKCWYCNNELTSGDSPKHFGICNKCYDKMFKSGDTIIHNLTNKIAELQKQLLEKEQSLEYFRDRVEKASKEIKDNYKQYNQLVNEYNELLTKFKSQPAEIVEKIKKFIHTGEYDDFGNEYLMSGSSVLEFLDEFLKEYQK